MNTILHLWKRRIIYLTKLYYKFATYQFDWVDLSYGIGLAAALGYYYLPVIKEHIDMLSTGPWFMALKVLTLVVLLRGNVRGYLKAADEVFLAPMNISGKKFILYSQRLNILLTLTGWGLFVSILYGLAPILGIAGRAYFVYFYVMGAIIKVLYMFSKFIIYQRLTSISGGIINKVFSVLYWGATYAFIDLWFEESKVLAYQEVSIIIGVLLVAVIYYIKKKTVINWSRWIADESNKRAANLSFWIKGVSMEKQSTKKSTIPVLSGRKLEPFTKKGALLLIYFRLLLRGQNNLLFMFQMLLILVVPLFVTKESLFIAVFHYFGIFMLANFLVSLWYQLIDHVWFNVYPFTFNEKNWAFNIAPLIIITPLILFISILKLIFSGSAMHPLMDPLILMLWGGIVIYIKNYMSLLKSSV